jgi:hypothetical protein
MERTPPKLRIVEHSPWGRAEAYRPDPIEMLRQRLRQDRVRRLQRAVAWWCIIIALFAFWYFAAQLVRGWLS